MPGITTGATYQMLGIPMTSRAPPSAPSPKLDFNGKGYGWICPKCGKVYSPFVEECRDCNKAGHKS